ncbi:asparaginase [Acinetobacter seifertii]|nr:asparaginase [Acinetobacter seifertii]
MIPPHLTVDALLHPILSIAVHVRHLIGYALFNALQKLQLEGYQHFVVIHGTRYTQLCGCNPSPLFRPKLSFVITGSQYPLLNIQGDNTREFTDAIENLYLALEQVIALL